jgi:hypothetical protein
MARLPVSISPVYSSLDSARVNSRQAWHDEADYKAYLSLLRLGGQQLSGRHSCLCADDQPCALAAEVYGVSGAKHQYFYLH